MKGFSQKKQINFEQVFSHVVKMPSIRVVIGLTTTLNLKVDQLDMKTTFMHGVLK